MRSRTIARVAAAMVAATLAVPALTGCVDRERQAYHYCISHGGSYHYNGGDAAYSCSLSRSHSNREQP